MLLIQPVTAQDSSSSSFAPPVHIPPRVPVNDPGLPRSLNGKFNSTQRIGEPNRSSPSARLSDIYESTYQTNQAGADQRQRRNGLQGRIGGLIPETNHSQNRNQPIAVQRNRGQIPPPNNTQFQQRNRRNGLQSRFYNFVNSNSQRGRYSGQQQVRSSVVENQPPRRNSNVASQRVVPQRAKVAARQEVRSSQSAAVGPMQDSGQDFIAPPKPEFNVQRDAVKRLVDQTVKNFQAERYADSDLPPAADSMLTSQDVDTQYYDRRDEQQQSPNRSVKQVQKEKDQFVSNVQLPDPDEIDDAEFESAPVVRTAQQSLQLPGASNKARNTKPVSVLNTGKGLEFDPVNDAESEIELPEPGEYDNSISVETYEPVASPGSNMLRRRNWIQEEDSDENDNFSLDDDLDDDPVRREENPLRKSCDEFRSELLNSPITDIDLDISPPGNLSSLGPSTFRTWRDQFGNELAQGTIADLRRGYVIIDTSNGGQVRLPFARLGDAEWLAVSDYWNLPINCGLGAGIWSERCWAPQTATWHASSLCHKPLYFEDIQLERYGHSHGPFLQPAASGLHFFSRLFFLPYNTAINPPNECQYALGFYRPGNCAPWLKDPFPISLSGASRQSFIYTGIGFLGE